MMHRTLVWRLGTAAVAASLMSACSDSTTAPSSDALVARKIAGPTADVGLVQLSYKSGADATEYCSKTADNTFSSAIGGCGASIVAPITTLNAGSEAGSGTCSRTSANRITSNVPSDSAVSSSR